MFQEPDVVSAAPKGDSIILKANAATAGLGLGSLRLLQISLRVCQDRLVSLIASEVEYSPVPQAGPNQVSLGVPRLNRAGSIMNSLTFASCIAYSYS